MFAKQAAITQAHCLGLNSVGKPNFEKSERRWLEVMEVLGRRRGKRETVLARASGASFLSPVTARFIADGNQLQPPLLLSNQPQKQHRLKHIEAKPPCRHRERRAALFDTRGYGEGGLDALERLTRLLEGARKTSSR